jgi:hypothetical protein
MYMIYQEIDFVWTIQWSFLESVPPYKMIILVCIYLPSRIVLWLLSFDCRNVADLSVSGIDG